MNQIQADMPAPVDITACPRLEAAMAMLSPISRRVVELWLEGLSKSQIAAEVGLGEEDISRIGIRAIEQVREILDRSSDARGFGPQKR